MADKYQLKAILTAVDKITPTTKQITRSFRIMRKSVSDIGNATRGLALSVGIASAAIGAGLFSSVKKIVSVSAEFEKFQAILETIEGSSLKARNSMDWVEEFAIKTPFELGTVMDSFVKLKTYGIDPTSGALNSAGDAAAAMGKPLTQAVEALADAMTGENERLKEFGIKAKKQGDKVFFAYTKNGKEMVKVAKASSRDMIEASITGIWNEQFGSAMERQSKTWDGMWSNMLDGVNKFILKIGRSGFFDKLKDQMGGLLTKFDALMNSGALDKLAKQISDSLSGALEDLVKWIETVDWAAFFQGIKETVVSIKNLVTSIGGLKTVFIALGVIMLAGPVAAIFSIIGAIWRLRLAFTALSTSAATSGAAVSTSMATSATASAGLINGIGALARSAGLLAAAFSVGWAIGTAINSALSDATKDKIGETIARLLAGFGVKEAEDALRANGITPAREVKYIPNTFTPTTDPNVITGDQTQNVIRGRKNIVGGGQANLKGDINVNFQNAPAGMRVDAAKTNQVGVFLNPDVGYRKIAWSL